MFVCLCNAIKESEVRDLARSGAKTANCVYESLGCEPHCETCTEFLQSVIDAEATAPAGT